MMIVLLAIPILQRTSRYTRRKVDVTAISTSLKDYIANNGETLPGAVSGADTDLFICGRSCSSGNSETATLLYYDPSIGGDISLVSTPTPLLPTGSNVIIDTGFTCNSKHAGVGSPAPQHVAILYAIETSPTTIGQQCSGEPVLP